MIILNDILKVRTMIFFIVLFFYAKGVDNMTYTLLGFGLTLTVLIGIETIRERK